MDAVVFALLTSPAYTEYSGFIVLQESVSSVVIDLSNQLMDLHDPLPNSQNGLQVWEPG
jgi:hypothetical protein